MRAGLAGAGRLPASGGFLQQPDLLDNLGPPQRQRRLGAQPAAPGSRPVGCQVPPQLPLTGPHSIQGSIPSSPAKWLLWSKPDSTWAWHLTATADGWHPPGDPHHASVDGAQLADGAAGRWFLMEFVLDFAMLRRMLRAASRPEPSPSARHPSCTGSSIKLSSRPWPVQSSRSTRTSTVPVLTSSGPAAGVALRHEVSGKIRRVKV